MTVDEGLRRSGVAKEKRFERGNMRVVIESALCGL